MDLEKQNKPVCEVLQAGRVPYQRAWDWQNQMAEARGQNTIPDRLILLHHPPTYTLGTSGHDEHLLLSPEALAEKGIEVFHVDRGGDITFHGPGQLVGYPIIQLPRKSGVLRADVVGYVRNLETIIIRTLSDYGVTGELIPGLTGVWVDTPEGESKICAIGARINVRTVTKHGFALNLNTDMSYFQGIIPCGIQDKGVTSLSELLGEPIDEAEAAELVIERFGEVMGFEMKLIEAVP